jgi:hypothetical protein
MDATVQSELLQQLPDVEPAFLREHKELLLGELGAVPGVDAVRAAVVRHLPTLIGDRGGREVWLQRAAAALRAYPDNVASGDPLGLMTRHPAWVGLCHLELADALGGDASAAREVAIAHARLGFMASARGDVGDGEILWAMAEAAEEVGWLERSDELLALAAEASFVDQVARDQVRLLRGTRLAIDDPSAARALLVPVADDEGLPHPVRVQAAFVLARITEAEGDLPGARSWLTLALDSVDPHDDPRVEQTLRAELARLV